MNLSNTLLQASEVLFLHSCTLSDNPEEAKMWREMAHQVGKVAVRCAYQTPNLVLDLPPQPAREFVDEAPSKDESCSGREGVLKVPSDDDNDELEALGAWLGWFWKTE